jgi:hypothetical protein
MPVEQYNPLDYANLTKDCVRELMARGPWPLATIPGAPFQGSGVYALFYSGDLPVYHEVKSPQADWPIYVGKAEPAGRRKGKSRGMEPSALHGRLKEHHGSILAASGTLSPDDFFCRYLVVTPLWITMAERFLIEHYQPLWNVCVEGFGGHNPGRGRHAGRISWWDVLHPGRPWAQSLDQGRASSEAVEMVTAFLQARPPRQAPKPLPGNAANYMDDNED